MNEWKIEWMHEREIVDQYIYEIYIYIYIFICTYTVYMDTNTYSTYSYTCKHA